MGTFGTTPIDRWANVMWNLPTGRPRPTARRGAHSTPSPGVWGGTAAVELLEPRTLLSGKRFEITPADLAPTGASNPIVPPLPTDLDLSQTFLLASRPGATKTIYLDFTGHVTLGTPWNSNYTSGRAIVTPPYSIDGNPGFSHIELATIQCIWQRVAEDFAPFDVNVTTIEPSVADLIKSGSGDQRWGIRVNIGGSYMDWLRRPAGGIAIMNSFGHAKNPGVFVFTEHRFGEEKYTADAISHEVGHTLGLAHKGAAGMAYYSGHGSGETGWAPIMGAAYNRSLSQWSKGEYPTATNQGDELRIITTGKGVNYRADDYGSTRQTASILPFVETNGDLRTVSLQGVIERNTDQDWFAFATTGGQVSLDFLTIARGANLDLLAQLYSASGELLVTSNPGDRLNASIDVVLPAGLYYIMVDGVGARGLADGYSDYGSLGQYSIVGTIAGSGVLPDANAASSGWIFGQVWHDTNGNRLYDPFDSVLTGWTVFLDRDHDGLFDPLIDTLALTDHAGRYQFQGLSAGEYRVVALAPEGWQSVNPSGSTTRAVQLGEAGLAIGLDFALVNPPEIHDSATEVGSPIKSKGTHIAGEAVVTDADTQNFAGARLTVQLTAGAMSTDRLFVKSVGKGPGLISVSKGSIRYGGTVIGTISGGSGRTPLVITFNNSATLPAIEAVLRSIVYRSTTQRPTVVAKNLSILLTEASGAQSRPVEKQLNILLTG